MKKIKQMLFISFAIITCGCSGEIDKVKNGTLTGYEQTTIGKAIESVFGEVEWNFFETDKGVKVVEAKGWPGKSLLTLKERKKQCEDPQKMAIQFILHTNSDSFDIGYCGFGERKINCGDLLYYIYDNNSSYEPIKIPCSIRKSFTDSRDKKEYKTVVIGKQEWMAENLNYETEESFCFNNQAEKCKSYGRLYTWNAAMKACPKGWHLPTQKEYNTLIDAVDGESTAGAMLKSTNWNHSFANQNFDIFNFSALPAGKGFDNKYFTNEHQSADFWTSTEKNEKYAFSLSMHYGYDKAHADRTEEKEHVLSVRCIKD